jgi:AcrR family transcriptional regulator
VSERAQARKRPTRAQKREANRERILAAARRVFGGRGYQAATIEEIADESGLSNGAIYYNFESKEELFLALLDARMRERIEHTRRTLSSDGPPATVEGALAQEARDVTRTLKQSREWRLLLLEFVAHAARNPRFGKRLKDHRRELQAALVEILDQHLSARHATPSMPIEQLAIAITALLNGLAMEELSDPGSVPDELLGDAITLLLASPGEAAPPKRRGSRDQKPRTRRRAG